MTFCFILEKYQNNKFISKYLEMRYLSLQIIPDRFCNHIIISKLEANVKFSWLQTELLNVSIRHQDLGIFAGEQGKTKWNTSYMPNLVLEGKCTSMEPSTSLCVCIIHNRRIK
jgi:hypothetical protein